ncbi:hypothetical protein [Endozoicomonas sp. 4G]|uniref:hypothetical protein n=1 Tax=Endozoicomonas sp. 4G TaxID=2872754 RepID=UPI002078B49A|nr:hypothetical protein [Endozoicomonas sp. 4G]
MEESNITVFSGSWLTISLKSLVGSALRTTHSRPLKELPYWLSCRSTPVVCLASESHNPFEVGAIEGGAIEEGAIEEGAIEEGAIEEGAIEEGAIEEGAIEEGAIEEGAIEEEFVAGEEVTFKNGVVV